MKKRKILVLALLLAGSTVPHFVQADNVSNDAPEVSTGVLRGRVVNSHREPLSGATVVIGALNKTAITDENGYYIMQGITGGDYDVTVNYLGYEPLSTSVSLPERGTTEKNLVLSELTTLQEVVVRGAFSGQHKAINMQKNNLGVTNVISAEQVGKFPDSNIGDALKRIPGINVQYDQGEARFGQVRGTGADLTSVTVNGNRLPSAEGGTRNVQLDLIPADVIQTIEVNKVVTPDMDADAIGGSINLITKNAPTRRSFSATLGSGWNFVSDKAQLNAGLTYGDLFFDNKLGVILSASYQNAPIGSDNAEFVWKQDEETGEEWLDEYEVRQYIVTRERQSYTASLNYKFNENHRISFKGIYNLRKDWENRFRLDLKDLEPDGKGKAVIETKGGTRRNARLEKQQTMDFNLGGEHLLGNLKIDWNGSYARATEDRPNERYISYEIEDQEFDLDLSDMRKPFMKARNGFTYNILNPNANAALDDLTQQQEAIAENDWKGAINFTLPVLEGTYGSTLKFGAKYQHKDKEMDLEFYEYEPLGDFTALNNTIRYPRKGFLAGSQYETNTPFVSNDFLGSLDLENPDLFEKKEVLEELAGEYNASEEIWAGYVRWDQKFGDDKTLVLGLRLENTHTDYQGYEYFYQEEVEDENTGAILTPESESLTQGEKHDKSYLNVLPSVIFKWDVQNDFKVRAAFTNTLARPKYEALVPSIQINRGDDELYMGNPDLNATLSYNLDLSAEKYFSSIGLVSAGIFYKRVNDLITSRTTLDYEYMGYTYEEFEQPVNIGDANVFGVEVALQRDLGFLHPALSCVGLYGNYTYTYSNVSNFNVLGRENEGDMRMPGSPEHTANASLSFEKWGLSARLSYNFASAFLDELGDTKYEDRYYDKVSYMDLNLGYTFDKKYTIYFEANNLLNQPLRYYQGTKDHTAQMEYYGVKINAGVKINL